MTMDMREMLQARAEKQQQGDQSFEAKKARAMEKLEVSIGWRAKAIRYVGPKEPQISELHRSFLRNNSNDMVMGHCRFCNPEVQPLKCPACDFEVHDKWRMWLHNKANPTWCQDRAARKARRWSQRA